jgi:hypothetical protein
MAIVNDIVQRKLELRIRLIAHPKKMQPAWASSSCLDSLVFVYSVTLSEFGGPRKMPNSLGRRGAPVFFAFQTVARLAMPHGDHPRFSLAHTESAIGATKNILEIAATPR